ncbi:NADPH-dependent quinone reductase ArsH [Colletotrichum liriopes]|uniref:NADPH-dependent quinone reductase ArsH n=1 Tax=Colletotrichum liriopes TaxID=708192 RepID=A0AA37LVA8_9PEZI|nr:NADPH-dependent quinone reductase ArsH [Colletotrichum liriopes]
MVLRLVDREILQRGSPQLRILLLLGSLQNTFLQQSVAFRRPSNITSIGFIRSDDVSQKHPKIDWLPLSEGSFRPTQGRTLSIAQVSDSSQSFNTVNSLHRLKRWMRMFVIPNQSCIAKAYMYVTAESAEEGCSLTPNRDRLLDCMEKLVKYTIVLRSHFDLFGGRFRERENKRTKITKSP